MWYHRPITQHLFGHTIGSLSSLLLRRSFSNNEATAALLAYRNRSLPKSKRRRAIPQPVHTATGNEPADNVHATLHDSRSDKRVSSILGGEPLSDPHDSSSSTSTHPETQGKSFRDWVRVFQLTWNSYKLTWEGFLSSSISSSPTSLSKDETHQQQDEQRQKQADETREQIIATAQQIQENVKSNIQTLEQTSQNVIQYAKDTTQIQNKTDLKRWMMMQMQLATDMLREFMNGYRQARQEEMERTITQYFKDLEDDPSKSNINKEANNKQDDDDNNKPQQGDEEEQPNYAPKRKTTRRLYQWVHKKE